MRPEQKRNLKNNETYKMTKLIEITKLLTKLEKIKNFLETLEKLENNETCNKGT